MTLIAGAAGKSLGRCTYAAPCHMQHHLHASLIECQQFVVVVGAAAVELPQIAAAHSFVAAAHNKFQSN